MEHIYPLTIIKDRYHGTYSQGIYTAWNQDFWKVPQEIEGDDMTCLNFWDDFIQGDIAFVGKGDTPTEALEDLKKVIKEFYDNND